MPTNEWVDPLIEHEIAYFQMIAECRRTENAAYLRADRAPEYEDANRALRLRLAGQSADAVAQQVVSYFRSCGRRPIVDLDPVSESQGFAGALLRAGMRPERGERTLMRYASDAAPPLAECGVTIEIEIVPNDTGLGEAEEWIETTVADDLGWPDEALWRTVARQEARYNACRLYLARLDGRAAGTCDLFESARWARLDSVVTRPQMRRRGVASALIARAVSDSLTIGNRQTYLFTETGSDAERLYARLGFQPWGVNVFHRFRA